MISREARLGELRGQVVGALNVDDRATLGDLQASIMEELQGYHALYVMAGGRACLTKPKAKAKPAADATPESD